jgi:hypothetical protein
MAMAAVGLFPALLAVAAIAVLAGAIAGRHPFWSEPELTLAEAAALKDRGTMLRLISNGVDPNLPARVRPRILKSDELIVTPLVASVGTRTPVSMQFLLAHGARMDAAQRAVIVCLAIKDEAQEILDFLEEDGRQERPDCEHVATPW